MGWLRGIGVCVSLGDVDDAGWGENGARLGRGVEGEVREEGEHLRGTYIYIHV